MITVIINKNIKNDAEITLLVAFTEMRLKIWVYSRFILNG